MRTKYRAIKTVVDGITFDSKKEARKYLALKKAEEDGQIKNLRCQVHYLLIPEQREKPTRTKTGKIKLGKLIERKAEYIADFVYEVGDETVVLDVKGCKTREYRLKRKLMLWTWGIRVREE